ncbi:dTDP-4-amino-4,6-dideoxy-D-galactose acyltransferase [Spirabiliibacterium falconis]|uniref:dTDP-4-amino-4,6-dideoxy-D-galactose acyltransferase n=1 Tax=Spirabiliibacterium falconis TaxID=572023 RepID=UPI001AAD5E72|nr:dTDP-4-amino-4,6-dideoxy-D-galactose acyltransferase [Spirabiliibacterium falconis]MBE2895257.1 dTDP-4-amino-4,6-dideoxy-D-galactose acyltransferase [Spirabiliibacterium falconis]
MALCYQLIRHDWESDFFQREIARLEFTQSAVSQPHFDDFDLIQCKLALSEQEKITCLMDLGFEQVEGEVDYCWQLERIQPTALCFATAHDIAVLQQLVSHAFADSRFRQPWFTALQNAQFYQCWIEKAVRGAFDDVCLVEKDQNTIKGAISVRQIDAQQARVGLLAVNPNYRGQGVAQALLAQASSWCAAKHIRTLWIATQQSNGAANRLYQKIGAVIAGEAAWFYKQITKDKNNDRI